MSVETHLNKMLHILRPRKIIYSLGLYTVFIILGALIVYAEVYLRIFLLSVSYLTNFEQYVIISLNFVLSSTLFCGFIILYRATCQILISVDYWNGSEYFI